MRLEIEDDIGFKWVLRLGQSRSGAVGGGESKRKALLLMHSHARWETKPSGGAEYLCLRYWNSNEPNQPIDQRDWSCGACSHKVPPEVERYYDTVRWGLDTLMFEDEVV
jgi:hypothetical protein